jgi:hypothetical protein
LTLVGADPPIELGFEHVTDGFLLARSWGTGPAGVP